MLICENSRKLLWRRCVPWQLQLRAPPTFGARRCCSDLEPPGSELWNWAIRNQDSLLSHFCALLYFLGMSPRPGWKHGTSSFPEGSGTLQHRVGVSTWLTHLLPTFWNFLSLQVNTCPSQATDTWLRNLTHLWPSVFSCYLPPHPSCMHRGPCAWWSSEEDRQLTA